MLNSNSSIKSTFGYLYSGGIEITFKQFILDPLQDAVIKIAFDNFMDLGSKPKYLKYIGCIGCNFFASSVNKVWSFFTNAPTTKTHKSFADFQYCGSTSTEMEYGYASYKDKFAKEFAIHSAIKISSTVVFPFLYKVYKDHEISNYLWYGVEEVVKFVGINPFEGLFTISNIIPENSIITNNIIANYIKDSYVEGRAKDYEYDKTMQDYNLWMEGADALTHCADYAGAIMRNIESPYIALKIGIFAFSLYSLNTNTEHKEGLINQAVSDARENLSYCWGH